MLQESYILGLKNRQYLIEQAEHNMKILQHAIWHYSRIIDSLLEQKKYEEIKEVFDYFRIMANVLFYSGTLMFQPT